MYNENYDVLDRESEVLPSKKKKKGHLNEVID
jgi:hypothetical protein